MVMCERVVVDVEPGSTRRPASASRQALISDMARQHGDDLCLMSLCQSAISQVFSDLLSAAGPRGLSHSPDSAPRDV
ncbi:hypothetical protein CgunFtcFv8_003478 [Champsocephalus gunnari]|uniref:Uncharacterized protein n=1 Tax=Champsocephalus gunnari TaxID=52237 RepID=A0AAN8HK65_CHAGU|nr:hypothetical protein CgunFtcFv8_003478 [Champsocephalus gunnari]